MSIEVRLDNQAYLWSGEQWLNADTFISPPGIVQQQLNRRYQHLIGQTTIGKKQRSQSGKNKGIQVYIGPLIVDFVKQRYGETEMAVSRDDIADYLLNHAEARTFLSEAYQKTDKKRSFEWYVANQVDWLSAAYTEHRSELQYLLERFELEDGKKAYQPANLS